MKCRALAFGNRVAPSLQAVSTATGAVEVHTVSDAYTRTTAEEAAGELDQFLHYIRII